jgi:hypothetical protein
MNEAARAEAGRDRPGSVPARIWRKLKARWGVTGWGVVAILASFSLAGMSVLKLAYPIVHAIVPHDAPGWQYWTVKLLIVIPVYEVLLLIWGTLLGQGRFFRLKLRQTARFLARPFRRG